MTDQFFKGNASSWLIHFSPPQFIFHDPPYKARQSVFFSIEERRKALTYNSRRKMSSSSAVGLCLCHKVRTHCPTIMRRSDRLIILMWWDILLVSVCNRFYGIWNIGTIQLNNKWNVSFFQIFSASFTLQHLLHITTPFNTTLFILLIVALTLSSIDTIIPPQCGLLLYFRWTDILPLNELLFACL